MDARPEPVWRRLFGFGPLLFVVLFVILLTGGRSRFFQDPGTFWHTATGNDILDQKKFLTADPFTYTFVGQEWTPYEWLGEVVMALVYRLGGFDLQLIGAVSLLAFTFAALGDRIVRIGVNPVAAACLTGIAVATAANHFHVRPHLLTMALMAWTMCRLSAVESGKKSLRSLLWLAPVFVIWTNTHGGALGGYATVALVFAGWLGLAAIRSESPVTTWPHALQLVAIGLIIATTAVMTPYGLDVPKVWWRLMQMPELKTFVIEHMPANIRNPIDAPFFLFGAVYAGLLLGLRRMPRATWLIPVVWFVLGCERCRHESLFAIVTLVASVDIFPHTLWAKWISSKRPDFYAPADVKLDASPWSAVVPLMIVGTSVLLHLTGSTLPVFGKGWVRFDQNRWPVELLDVMKNEADGARGLPIFNEYNDGGFIIWFLPEYRPFVDDRCEVFGGAWLKRFTDAARSEDVDTVREYLEANQSIYGSFDHALVRPDSGFGQYFATNTDEWELVKASPAHAFYRRVNAPRKK